MRRVIFLLALATNNLASCKDSARAACESWCALPTALCASHLQVDFNQFLYFLMNTSFTACAHGGGVDPAPKAFEALAAGFARLPSRPKVLLLAPPPLYAAPYDFRPEAINYEVPLALPAVAKRVRNASASLRVFEALGGRGLACPECFFGDPRYTNDGVHPTDYGYHRIADGACAALEDGLGVACAPHAFPRPRPQSAAHRAKPAALAALAAALLARELAS